MVRETLGLIADERDEAIVKEVIGLMYDRELTVDRASRVLADARSMLPLIAKLEKKVV